MNRKSTRNNLRAPTSKPANHIAPSATLGMDDESPASTANGVTAPELLASHDVLQAALAPAPADAVADETTAAVVTESDAPTVATRPAASARKPAKKAAKAVAAAPVDDAAPVKPVKVPKIKFVEVTFALPESEAELLDAMKKTHQANGLTLKKGQLLRAGLLALADIDAERLAQLVSHLPVEPRTSKKKK